MIAEMVYTLCFMFFAQNAKQDNQIDLQRKMQLGIGTHALQKKEVGRSDWSDGIDWNMGICLGHIVSVLDEIFRIIRR